MVRGLCPTHCLVDISVRAAERTIGSALQMRNELKFRRIATLMATVKVTVAKFGQRRPKTRGQGRALPSRAEKSSVRGLNPSHELLE